MCGTEFHSIYKKGKPLLVNVRLFTLQGWERGLVEGLESVKGQRDVAMQYIIDCTRSSWAAEGASWAPGCTYCEIFVPSRKRWPMEFAKTFTGGLRPFVTMKVICTCYHTPDELHDFGFFPKQKCFYFCRDSTLL